MVTGWLSPRGKFLQCPLWGHLEVLDQNRAFVESVSEIVDLLNRIERDYQDQQEYAEEVGSHNAEWHNYEIKCDGFRCDIRRLLLNNGFIRVGESKGTLHFEGRPNQLKSKYQQCRDFADSYGADCVFEPQR